MLWPSQQRDDQGEGQRKEGEEREGKDTGRAERSGTAPRWSGDREKKRKGGEGGKKRHLMLRLSLPESSKEGGGEGGRGKEEERKAKADSGFDMKPCVRGKGGGRGGESGKTVSPLS